jgi:hypothetical protein
LKRSGFSGHAVIAVPPLKKDHFCAIKKVQKGMKAFKIERWGAWMQIRAGRGEFND